MLREFESPIVLEYEDRIYSELKTRNLLQDESDKNGAVMMLARSMAKLLHNVDLEGIYAAIFGSQINLLAHINSINESGETDSAVREYYARKQGEFPRLKDYPFEKYIGYLINTQLVRIDDKRYRVTVKGREFLQYIASTGKTFNRDM